LQATAAPESRARWEVLAKPPGADASGSPGLDPADPAHQNVLRNLLLDFIADFANWDNSTTPAYLETSRALTQAAHEALGGEPGSRPLVVDPFAGGGSIPLEALRVGADAFASDLNPVAVLLNKVVLEYIPKYGQKLADEVRKWGRWIKEQAEKELAEFYPKDPDGATPIAYLWARTILSDAPSTDETPVEVPLIRSLWLSKKSGRMQALRWSKDNRGIVESKVVTRRFADGSAKKVREPQFEIVEPKTPAEVDKGTSSGGAATCPITGFTTNVEAVRDQIKRRFGGAADSRMLVVVTAGAGGRRYRIANDADLKAEERAAKACETLKSTKDNSKPSIPSGKLNHLRGFFNVVLYGMSNWSDLFAPRQLLGLTTLIRLAQKAMDQVPDSTIREALHTMLALAIDRCADKCASVVVWNIVGEKVEHVFGRQALPMVWDFAEANLLSDIGWSGACDWVTKVIEKNADASLPTGVAVRSSATSLPLPEGSVDAVVSDPPYYAAIPYADLSDFFYSWLRLSIGHIHSDLFKDELSPKGEECVQLSHRAAMYREKDASWFENTMTIACKESQKATKDQGIAVIVFANKETVGWEAMLAALIAAGWRITASWPIDTEMATRLRARNSAALASSIHLVCRPRRTQDLGDWRDVLSELPQRVHEWMPRLTNEGVVGADAIFACLGPALEIFSRYSRVEKSNGDQVLLKEYLEHVWAAVSREALSTIFRDADAAGLEPDARLTAMWLWTIGGGAPATKGKPAEEGESDDEEEEDETRGKTTPASGFILEFDAARKIAQGLGIHLEKSQSIVAVKGDKARLLPVAERTKHLFGKDTEDGPTGGKKAKKKLIQPTFFDELDPVAEAEGGWKELKGPPPGTTILDRLHQAMILFGAQRGELLKRFLVEDGVGKDARFWKLAQSLAALYPPGTDERRWVEGVLARKKGLGL
jgi:putative DNA methylase